MGSLAYLICFNNPLEIIRNNTLKRKHHMDIDFREAYRMLQYLKREGLVVYDQKYEAWYSSQVPESDSRRKRRFYKSR